MSTITNNHNDNPEPDIRLADVADPEAAPAACTGFAAGLFPGLTVQDLTLTEDEVRDTFEEYL